MGWVSIIYHNCFSYILSLRNPTRCHWIICNASILVIVNPSILRLGKKWSFGLGRVHGGAMLEQPRTITQFSTHFRLCSPQWLWPSMLKNCGLSKYSFKRLDKWLEVAYFFSSGRDGQYTCINHQHSLPLKITHTINISTALTFTEHFTTPLPDDIPTESTPSGFDVVPGETSFSREPTAIDFLAEAWAKSLSLSHHFWLVFLTGHIDSAMIGHTCMTICPSGFATINNKITVMYTNKFGQPHTESILCRHLAPHSLKKCNVNIIILRGSKVGVICHVKKAESVKHTYNLMTPQQEQLKKQEMKDHCGVEAHANNCQCSIFCPL